MTGIPLDRRDLMRIAAATSTAVALGAATTTEATAAPGPADRDEDARPGGPSAAEVFRHGVASGDPLADGVVLWTRVTPTDDCRPGSRRGRTEHVSWQIATDRDCRRVVRSGLARTGPDRDHTVHVDVRGLRPATTYWYRFRIGRVWSPVGRARTAPSRHSRVENVRFGVVSCANWEAGYFAAYRHLAARGDLDAWLHLGDYLYEFESGRAAARGVVVRPHEPVHELRTLADYRVRYGRHRTDPDLQALHAAAPCIPTWDDHEICGDTWSGGARDHDDATDGPWAQRFAAARQAYFEWLPVRVALRDSTQRRLVFGDLLDLTMLDLRSFRSKQDAAATADPTRTITGRPQMAWLKDGLTRSRATWHLVGSSVMAAPLLFPTGGTPPVSINADQWDGYAAEQAELFGHLRDHAVHNTVFLSGDVHSSWAMEVPATRGGPSVGAQFTITSVTSDNFDDVSGSPPGVLNATLVPAVRQINPHVRWAEVETNGYGVLDVREDRVQMDWLGISDRTKPDTGTHLLASYRVDAGTQQVTPAAGPL